MPVRSVMASVHHDVFEPLYVRLWVAEHLTHKLHVSAHDSGPVRWKTGVKDGPVWRSLCNMDTEFVKLLLEYD